jgi:hypothetical protein
MGPRLAHSTALSPSLHCSPHGSLSPPAHSLRTRVLPLFECQNGPRLVRAEDEPAMSRDLLRQPPASNQTLHPNESQYLADRRKLFPDAWRAWVGDGSKLGYDLDKLGITANNGSGLPVIGIATSGGGYRCVSPRYTPP